MSSWNVGDVKVTKVYESSLEHDQITMLLGICTHLK